MKKSIVLWHWFLIAALLLVFCGRGYAQNDSLLAQKAAAYLLAKKPDSARYFATLLCRQAPTAQNYMLLGSIYEILNKREDADVQYNRALESAGQQLPLVYEALGQVALRRGQPAEALRQLQRSLDAAPRAVVHYRMALINDSLGKSESALEHYRDAARLDTDNRSYQEAAFVALHEAGYVAESIPYLERAVSLDTTDIRMRRQLAFAYTEVDRYEGAARMLHVPASSIGMTDTSYYLLAKALFELGDTLAGIDALQKARIIAPARDFYYEELAQVYAGNGQYANLLSLMQEGAARGVGFCTTFVSHYRDNIDTIGATLQQLDATNLSEGLLKLAQLYLAIWDYRATLKVLGDYRSSGGAENETYYTVGAVALLQLGQYREAKALLDRSPSGKSSPLQPLLLYRLKDYAALVQLMGDWVLKETLVARPESELLFKSYTALGRFPEAAVVYRTLH